MFFPAGLVVDFVDEGGVCEKNDRLPDGLLDHSAAEFAEFGGRLLDGFVEVDGAEITNHRKLKARAGLAAVVEMSAVISASSLSVRRPRGELFGGCVGGFPPFRQCQQIGGFLVEGCRTGGHDRCHVG